ncbi:SRPBCC domain-containing protein [Alkalihalobacillus macyae]|uniref:SRPBCC family protein n=1 Tax=Guptibacillus hwajinpoensis TaxID=208199 RepID=UPI00273A9209|nr:SRPBCC domain-containing protein [Alkalihalobacillus macyae]MDP4549568.1 SRPBCC domain-containing protein [Alkalihalobacillus macyae]
METDHLFTLELSKVFSVKLEKMYRAWTNPDEIVKWWGPEGYTTTIEDFNLEEGGTYKFIMTPPEGDSRVLVGKYVEIIPNNKLVFTWKWDNSGQEFPETQVTVEFFAERNGTELKLKHELLPSQEAAEGHNMGWTSSLDDKLKKYLG